MTQPCATVVKLQVLQGFRLELTFSDGIHGAVDLKNRIIGRGGIFKSLENPDYFRQVSLDQELGTVVWPNGADICPDLLYSWATGQPVPSPESMNIAM
jgi:hypothetical protein